MGTKRQRTAIVLLALAAIFNLLIAIWPLWTLAPFESYADRLVWVARIIFIFDFQGLLPQFVQAVLPALLSGYACVAGLIVCLVATSSRVQTIACVVPICVVAAALFYVFAKRGDVHILVISLVPLIAALWVQRRRGGYAA